MNQVNQVKTPTKTGKPRPPQNRAERRQVELADRRSQRKGQAKYVRKELAQERYLNGLLWDLQVIDGLIEVSEAGRNGAQDRYDAEVRLVMEAMDATESEAQAKLRALVGA